MSFDSRERSLATGRPVRLYEFRRGTLRWTYCSADRDLQWQGQVWRALPISDDGVRLTGETSADALTITAPATLDVAQLYRVVPPSAEIEVLVRNFHDGEADLAASARLAWLGSISGVKWAPEGDRCQIYCESLAASMDRSGLRLTWERNCPYTVYDHNCKVDRTLKAVPAVLTAMDGVSITGAEFASGTAGRFSGGFVRWPIAGGEFEQRTVLAQAGGVLRLLGGTYGLAVGLAVVAYPGCRQTDSWCHDEFGNRLNFGGFSRMPLKSPFDGTPMI